MKCKPKPKEPRATKTKPITPLRRSQYQIYPPQSPDRHERLRVSIRHHGVENPTTWDDENNLLDGWEREAVCAEEGIACPREVRHFETEAEKFQFILNVNAHRRPSLTQKQKRAVIEAYLQGDPEVADNMLGETIGVSKNTVLAVRRRLESSRRIRKVKRTRGKDGKLRPVKYQKRILTSSPSEFRRAQKIIKDLPDDCAGKTLDITTAKKRARMARDAHNSAAALPAPAVWKEHEQTGIKIIRGSCLNRHHLGPATIDLAVTSPPYNCGIKYDGSDDNLSADEYRQFTEQWLANVYYWLGDDGRLCVNVPAATYTHPTFPFEFVNVASQVGFQLRHAVYWDKISLNDDTSWGSWCSPSAPFIRNQGLELILVLFKKRWEKDKKGRTDLRPEEYPIWTQNVWRFAGEKQKSHPAPFPEELPRRCIKLFSWLGDTVLDPFSGSGTTLTVCRQLGRKGIGIELSPRYCEMIRQRVMEGSVADRMPA